MSESGGFWGSDSADVGLDIPNNTDREALIDDVAKVMDGVVLLSGSISQKAFYGSIDNIIELVHTDIKKRVLEAVRETIRKYGQNSTAYIHQGDDDIKIIKAIKKEFKR